MNVVALCRLGFAAAENCSFFAIGGACTVIQLRNVATTGTVSGHSLSLQRAAHSGSTKIFTTLHERWSTRIDGSFGSNPFSIVLVEDGGRILT